MKKTIIALGCFLMMMLVATSHSHRDIGYGEGNIAPTFALQDDSDSVSLGNLRGRHVLLTFWSSADAKSRINNKMYNTYLQRNPKIPLTWLSINYDRNEALFREIAKLDNIQFGRHIYDRLGKESDIYGQFHLNNGYKSILIDPSGKIVAVNPGTQRLQEILQKMPTDSDTTKIKV